MLKRTLHPGIILKDELDEIGMSAAELARQLQVPVNRFSQIIAGKRSISADTALRLGHWFKTSPQFWMNLQSQFDLMQAELASADHLKNLPRWKEIA